MDNESKYWRFIERDKKYTSLGSKFALDCIESFTGELIEDTDNLYAEDDFKYYADFIGTVFYVMPSGKFYMPWACSNITWLEAAQDHCFREGLESELDKHGFWLESGEGDPCDLFICHAFEGDKI
jgi:hypothetical protein